MSIEIGPLHDEQIRDVFVDRGGEQVTVGAIAWVKAPRADADSRRRWAPLGLLRTMLEGRGVEYDVGTTGGCPGWSTVHVARAAIQTVRNRHEG